MTSLRSGSATDVGRRRQNNQDMVLDSDPIFAVADGMGGHQGGEVAAKAAVEALGEAFRRQPTMEGFEQAIQAANDAVARQARGSAELRNMGTTLTALAQVSDGEGDLLTVANIGDSRGYLLRDGELTQLTEDHSVPQELFRQGQLTEDQAAVDPRRNILTRVLGPSFGAGPDMQNIVPFTGDRLLLCSDGLYNEVSDGDIAHVLRTEGDPAVAAQQLVDMANGHGGADNISVVVVDVVDDDNRAATASAALANEPSPARPPRTGGGGALMTAEERNAQLRRLSGPDNDEGPRNEAAPSGLSSPGLATGRARPAPIVHEAPRRRLTGRVVIFLLVFFLVLGGAGAAIAFYARGAYYVGFDQGQVAIFKGRPGGLLWFKPTVEKRTTITEPQVPPARVADVQAGHEVATLADAHRYVDNLVTQTTGPPIVPTVSPPTTLAPSPPPSSP